MATQIESQIVQIERLRSLSFNERLRTLRSLGENAGTMASSTACSAKTSRQFELWSSSSPFDHSDLFARKLTQIETTSDEFQRVLDLDSEDPTIDSTPGDWKNTFEDAFNQYAGEEPVFETASEDSSVDFNVQLMSINPLLKWGLQQLRKTVCTMNSGLPIARRFRLEILEQDWLQSIRGPAARMLARVSALELGIAKIGDQLQGDSPEERYRSFFQQFNNPQHARTFWNEYPVLARQLTEMIETSLNVLQEFLEHLQADWDAIENTFVPDRLGCLSRVHLSQGDSHAGGHGVIIAQFDSGTRVVYKPRPLGVEVHFQQLLEWLNERGAQPAFRTQKMVDAGNRGWVEFVAQEACRNEGEMQRFFRRQGGLIALFYAMNANDLHSQNLIACGEHPVAIDLETLFHPTPFRSDSHAIDRLLHSAHEHSVLKTGILPQRVWANGSEQGVDISGIGGGDQQIAPGTTLCWENPGTDEMRVTRDQFEMAAEKNRPELEESVVSAFEYRDEIRDGFVDMYQLLLRYRSDLLSEGGPMSWFENDWVRVILRDTRTYAVLLDESYHPDFMRDALDRDQLFDRLWLRTVHQPHLCRVIESEQADLRRRDIPSFSTKANSVDLVDGHGESVREFFDTSGIEATRRRIQHLSVDDLERQLWFVETSLATLQSGKTPGKASSEPAVPPTTASDTDQSLIQIADQIAGKLEQLAVQEDGLAAWYGASYLNGGWAVDILGLDLYDGLSGIALFLAYVGEVTGNARHTELAKSATATLQHFLRDEYQPPGIGGFSGLGGVVYALSHLGALWGQAELLDLAERLSNQHANMIEDDDQFDIVSGTAGLLCGLLSLHAVRPSQSTLDLARRCGHKLVAEAIREGSQASWLSAHVAKQPLAGISHGAGGIAHALIELHRRSPDIQFLETARAAIQFENTLYSPAHKNWTDRRKCQNEHSTTPEGMMIAWCHGAPGVGLTRLGSRDQLDAQVVHHDLQAAIDSTLAAGFGGNHSLCHGAIGNLVFLNAAAKDLDDCSLTKRVSQIVSEVVGDMADRGWQCGIPIPAATPGLMSGLAGVGYGLLHLAASDRVPNVLTLAPPLNGALQC